jgi:hypothetical protein
MNEVLEMSIEDAVKIIENVTSHETLKLSKNEHYAVGLSIETIKASLLTEKEKPKPAQNKTI